MRSRIRSKHIWATLCVVLRSRVLIIYICRGLLYARCWVQAIVRGVGKEGAWEGGAGVGGNCSSGMDGSRKMMR